ncbi:MAG: tRNA (adenosine(37)-N6)-dimethylallyltransferase MiaA [Candidatus Krumholzibacteriota bacterium]|nr:tRNA (adenosine(37)-N6)-dimethylallyltransferase MiaA [Candidatus Krumholzibacteriota bacterium]
MDPLLIIGPTAIGKSALAMRIAGEIDAEIVSIDSRQIYKQLDIGTSKPTAEDQMNVPHHLIDILDIDQKPDANSFGILGRNAITGIIERGKTPILVGGSGMYLRSVLEGLFRIDLDPEDRNRFALEVKDVETEILYARLSSVDVESSKRIHKNDRYRIIRALEVFTLTGTDISTHFARHRETGKDPFPVEFQKTGLRMEMASLRRVISCRTMQMFDLGWVDEVKSILGKGANTSWPGMQTLGYPEIVRYIKGEESREAVIDRINILTGQYAKRQMTWFNKEPDVEWIDIDKESPFETLIKNIDIRGENC